MEGNTLKLRPEQEDMLEKIRSLDRLFIIGKMRTGKTLPSAMVAQETPGRTLVVCPPNVKHVWDKHFEIIGYEDYDLLSSGKLNKEFKASFKKSPYNRRYSMLIIDESHQYRRYSARYQCMRMMIKKLNFKKIVALTGTPVHKNEVENFYPISLMTDKYGTSMTAFQQVFCVCINPRSDWPQYKIRDDIYHQFMETVREFSFFYEGKEIVHPEHKVVRFKVSPLQKKFIYALEDNKRIRFNSSEHVNMSKSNKKSKALQILSGFYILNAKVTLTPCLSPKWFIVNRLVKRHQTRIVIWISFIKEREFLFKLLKNYRVEDYSNNNRERFNDDDIDILICHPKSVGPGINLQHAEAAIYVSHAPSVDLEQSYDRLSAFRGKTGKVIYHVVPAMNRYNLHSSGLDNSEANKRMFKGARESR